ncbi:MAG: PP0621 family protein [Thiohalorhabdus sp.]|uniref:PP0621 family protein n=1 Tax=Thiohalorhabdus sp. TaxID=3094134 RepID=UPI0039806FC1
MILRLIALAVLIYFAYRLVRRVLAKLQPPRPDTPPTSESQPVVPCKACGTFVPKDRARTDDRGHFYCSDRCLQETRERD